VASGDEAAFTAIVRRHGPMVLGVCRRVVGDPHLAEDAFQATFLVLARRAAVVRPRHLVGHWLYGVAYRTALKARTSAMRLKAKEKQVDAMPHRPVSPDEVWADLQPVLDAELARLPDKYRIPIVLCDLNGRPQRDVAHELRLPPATLANRLAAARRLLAKRLTVRGVALSGGAVAAALGWHAATSAVSPTLANATVRAACAVVAGTPVGLPVPVVQLSEGVMRMFVLSKLKSVAAGVATCLLLLASLGLVAGPSLQANPDEKPAKPPVATTDATKPADPHRLSDNDDLTFLRRRSLDLRGTLPTVLEVRYFLADKDDRKRAKVTEWMLEEHGSQKVTSQCAACHVGAVFADFDRDGALEHGHLSAWHKQVIARWLSKDESDKADVTRDLYKIDVDKARNVAVAALAELRLAEAGANEQKERSVEHQKRVDEARIRLAQAQIELKRAEEKLAKEDDAGHLRIQRKKLAEVQQRVAKDYDGLIAEYWWVLRSKAGPTDLEFLRQVSLDLRGLPPTKVEENYFLADKDPKKREKLLATLAGTPKVGAVREKFVDELLADPEVQKRWAVLWKERIEREHQRADVTAAWFTKTSADRLDRLLTELLASKRADASILDALCLATVARFPTETEKKLILDGLKDQPDRRAAWDVVLKALASTQEAKAHAEALAKRGK
jgi:RNA polymerase sigma factor (sigma-70 family)